MNASEKLWDEIRTLRKNGVTWDEIYERLAEALQHPLSPRRAIRRAMIWIERKGLVSEETLDRVSREVI